MNSSNRLQSNILAAICALVTSAAFIGLSVIPAELSNVGSLVI